MSEKTSKVLSVRRDDKLRRSTQCYRADGHVGQ